MIEDSIWNGLAVVGFCAILTIAIDYLWKAIKKVKNYKIRKKQ